MTDRVFTLDLEKYSSGERGAPAKGVGRVSGARVQISPSPPNMNNHHILYDEVVIFYFQLYAVLDNIPAPCVDVLLKTVQIDFSAG